MNKARDILIALNIKYDEDWNKLYHALETKEDIDTDALLKDVDTSKYITILDVEYPDKLKRAMKPPFVYLKDKDIVSLFGNTVERDYAIKYLEDRFKKNLKMLSKASDLDIREDSLYTLIELNNCLIKLKNKEIVIDFD